MEQAKYVNAFNFALSPMDLRLNLMVSEPVMDASGAVLKEENLFVGKFVMTLPLAKDLAQRLTEAIARLEEETPGTEGQDPARKG